MRKVKMRIDFVDPYYIDNTYHPLSYTYLDNNIKSFEKIISQGNIEEDEMSLTKKYLFNKKSAKDRVAIEQGALNEDGTLTEQGKDLLLNLLLQDKDIRTKFDLALSVAEDEEK